MNTQIQENKQKKKKRHDRKYSLHWQRFFFFLQMFTLVFNTYIFRSCFIFYLYLLFRTTFSIVTNRTHLNRTQVDFLSSDEMEQHNFHRDIQTHVKWKRWKYISKFRRFTLKREPKKKYKRTRSNVMIDDLLHFYIHTLIVKRLPVFLSLSLPVALLPMHLFICIEYDEWYFLFQFMS